MRRIFSIIAALAFLLPIQAKEKEIIKTGWNLGPLPVVGFDSDLGFQYGVCCDIFNFGNGSNYPKYDYKINIEASTYTKGSSILRTYGDFKTLIPDGKLFFDVTYFNAPKFGFYGYNGFASEFAPDRKGYHFMSRKQFRVLTSIQKKLTGNLNLAVGLAYYNIATDHLSLKDYDGLETLYNEYINNDLIRSNEKNGGNVTQLRAGVVYDTRNHDSDPTDGVNMEASLVFAPDIIDGNGYSNLGLHFCFSEFVSFSESARLTFACRTLMQLNLWGDMPYYFTNNINSMFFRKLYTEAIGGNASVRGINRNGVLGEGMLMFNFELRWRIYDFKFINQNWQIAANPFFDTGRILQPYRLEKQKESGLYSGKETKTHYSAGAGLKLVMNHNMVLSFEAGRAFDKNDGEGLWTNVGFNYLF